MRRWLALAAAGATAWLLFQEIDARIRRSEAEVARLRAEGRARAAHSSGALGILESRLAAVERDAVRSDRLHRMAADEFERLRREWARDGDDLARRILLPSVQVNGRGSVGGGTIIQSRPDGEGWSTFVVTAYHVIQKAVARKDMAGARDPVEVRVYGLSGAAEEVLEADLVAFDERKDIALLKLRSRRRFENVARLAPREALRTVSVFAPVYAVGCPLGHDPLPTPGEISTLHKEVNGEKFWMMSAPTIFGNSGGGVFHRETHQMVGIAAMVCTYDGFVSTPVPHLGILVSLMTLYDWLDSQYLQFVYDSRFTPELCERLRLEAARPLPPSSRARTEY